MIYCLKYHINFNNRSYYNHIRSDILIVGLNVV